MRSGYTRIESGGLLFAQYNPEAEAPDLFDDIDGHAVATPHSVRKTSAIPGSDAKHFARPGEIVPLVCEDADLLTLRPSAERIARTLADIGPFFNLERLDRWPHLAALLADMGDRGEPADAPIESWDLGLLLRQGLYRGERGKIEGPFRNRFLTEGNRSDGAEIPYNLKYDPILAVALNFLRDPTDRNWLLLANLGIGVACSGIRYGSRDALGKKDRKVKGRAEYSKGNGAQGIGFRPHWYESPLRGMLVLAYLCEGRIKPIDMAVQALLDGIANEPPNVYAEEWGCREERFKLENATTAMQLPLPGPAINWRAWVETALEHYAYRDEDEPTGFTVQDKGYPSPWMVIPFYEQRLRSALLIGRNDLARQAANAGALAWEAAKVIEYGLEDGDRAWLRYRYDNRFVPAADLAVKDTQHVTFAVNFLEMIAHPDLEMAERAAFSTVGDSLSAITAGVRTPWENVSIRDADQGPGFMKEAFLTIQNATRGLWR